MPLLRSLTTNGHIGLLHAYTLDDSPPAHAALEHNRVFGKLVGVIEPADLAFTVQR